MNTKEEFNNIMEKHTEIALATSVNDVPNVRIVNFYYAKDTKSLFFSTFKTNDKVQEIEENNQISFTTIPHQSFEHVRGKAIAKKSPLNVFDVKEQFVDKMPHYKEIIYQFGKLLDLYEIKLGDVQVLLDVENQDTLSLSSREEF